MSLALNNLTPEQNYEPNSYFIFAYAACKYIIQQNIYFKTKVAKYQIKTNLSCINFITVGHNSISLDV